MLTNKREFQYLAKSMSSFLMLSKIESKKVNQNLNHTL